jgi:hypothetical protein
MARRPLAQDRVWPVSESDLRRGLGELIDLVRIVWVTWDQRNIGDPLSVKWTPKSEGVGAKGDESLSIWVHPIPRLDSESPQELVRTVVLPDLRTWVGEVPNATATWRGIRHERRWSVTSGVVAIHDDDGMHILDRERG